MSQLNKLNLYVVGRSIGYASWLHHELVKDMEEADLVLFTGGEDVDPRFYMQDKGKFTYPNTDRDLIEVEEAEKAIMLKKPIFGTCRGAQLGCVMAGGVLVQHMNHPYQHNITLYDGTVVETNSLHHQLQHPHNLHPSKFVVAGYSEGLSNIYLNGKDKPMLVPSMTKTGAVPRSFIKEAELVYYRENNWLGIQGHPEMMPFNSRLCRVLRAQVELMINGELDLVLSLSIPTKRYVDEELVILDDEREVYKQLLSVREAAETN